MRNLIALLVPLAMQVSAAGVDDGIPIHNELIQSRCGGCHVRSAEGLMGRISQVRTSPEVWQQIAKRMVRLNGLKLTAEEAREVVKYLSWNNGLAPEEVKTVFWEAEHRALRDQDDMVPASLQKTCNYCHTIGRVLTQRRTRGDYEKLAAMHVALFPGAETAVFRPRKVNVDPADIPIRSIQSGGGQPTLEPAGSRTGTAEKLPIDTALDYLSSSQPLITPEWSSWRAAMKVPKLAGQWLVSGQQAGHGKFFGTVTITPGAAEDEFNTKIEIKYVARPGALTRSGKGIVYTGYSWRGRSKADAGASPETGAHPAEAREAMMLSRDGTTMEGRWFWGGYDEFGMEVKLTRASGHMLLSGLGQLSVQSPSETSLQFFGANLPSDLRPADFDLGPGITAKKVALSGTSSATVEIAATKGLSPGYRDISVRGVPLVKAFAVYDKVDYIKTTPDAGMARLGGTVAPKQYAQFEAIGFSNGLDRKSGTADDVALGPLPASWSVDEFISTPDDDDVKFVGTLNDSGLFTPAAEGPNAERKKQSNNYPTNNWGDVWVNAAVRLASGETLRARTYLVVTIPVYVRYDQPEISQ